MIVILNSVENVKNINSSELFYHMMIAKKLKDQSKDLSRKNTCTNTTFLSEKSYSLFWNPVRINQGTTAMCKNEYR